MIWSNKAHTNPAAGWPRTRAACYMVACDEHQMQTVVTDAGDTKFSIRRRVFNQKKEEACDATDHVTLYTYHTLYYCSSGAWVHPVGISPFSLLINIAAGYG